MARFFMPVFYSGLVKEFASRRWSIVIRLSAEFCITEFFVRQLTLFAISVSWQLPK
jgi:hypothetical protein